MQAEDILLPASFQTRGTFLSLSLSLGEDVGGREGETERGGGEDRESSVTERKRENRELWSIYRRLRTDVKK